VRAVRVSGSGTVEVRDVEPVVRDGVRVKVMSAGICGTDLHLAAMGLPAVTVGHEIAGVLDDGTAVAIEPQERQRAEVAEQLRRLGGRNGD